jgi:phosphatidylglycerophosphate synthase
MAIRAPTGKANAPPGKGRRRGGRRRVARGWGRPVVVVVKQAAAPSPSPVALPDLDLGVADGAADPEVAGREYRMREFEHPVDLLVVSLSSWLIRLMREVLGLTPNHVTALSIVASAVALVYLWQGRLRAFVAAGAVAYWMDDLDGAMARRYNMGTKIGEYLDHLSDLAFFVGIVLVLAFRYDAFRKHPWLMMALLLSALIPATHNACAARACGKDEGAIGVVADIMCPTGRDDSACTSLQLRWLGGPGYQVVMFLLVSLIVSLRTRCAISSCPDPAETQRCI